VKKENKIAKVKKSHSNSPKFIRITSKTVLEAFLKRMNQETSNQIIRSIRRSIRLRSSWTSKKEKR